MYRPVAAADNALHEIVGKPVRPLRAHHKQCACPHIGIRGRPPQTSAAADCHVGDLQAPLQSGRETQTTSLSLYLGPCRTCVGGKRHVQDQLISRCNRSAGNEARSGGGTAALCEARHAPRAAGSGSALLYCMPGPSEAEPRSAGTLTGARAWAKPWGVGR